MIPPMYGELSGDAFHQNYLVSNDHDSPATGTLPRRGVLWGK
jgi:hypothetical protein